MSFLLFLILSFSPMNKNKVVFTICLAALLVGGIIMIWLPRLKSYIAQKAELTIKQAELDDKAAYFQKIDEALAKIKDNQENFDKISSAMPVEFLAPEIFDYLQREAVNNGLLLKSVSAGPQNVSKVNVKIKENTITLSLFGSYSAIKNFLSALNRSARMLETQSIKFSAPAKESKQKDIYTFDLTLKAYSY